MAFLSLAGLFAIFAMYVSPVVAQKSAFEIIDVHAHFLPGPGLAFGPAVDAAVREMDKFGVARTIVMSPPRSEAIKLNYDYPDFRAALEKHPGRFAFLAGGGSLNPFLHAHADPASVTMADRHEFTAIAKKALDQGAKGFGEMSSLHISLSRMHKYGFVPADHPLLLLLADVAAEHNVPLDLHMDALIRKRKPPSDLVKFPNNPNEFPATLPALERLLSHNPKAKIIWDHGGADHLGDFSAKTIRAFMDKYSNLFVSLKVVGPGAPTHNKLFSKDGVVPDWLALLRRHPDRFMIGTDNFYVHPDLDPGRTTSGFSKSNIPKLSSTVHLLSLLPKDLARKIGSENAIRVFKLSPIQATPAAGIVEPKPVSNGAAQDGLCKDGNIDHCKFACSKGVRAACNRLKRGR